jgi:hypothetical protein
MKRQSNFQISLPSLKRVLQAFILVLIFIGILQAVQIHKAQAVVTLSPDPGAMPADIRDYLENADIRPFSPSIASWATPSVNWFGTSVTVPAGTTTVPLTFNGAATVGWRPSSTTFTRFYVEAADTGVGGLVGNYVQPQLSPNQNVVGATGRSTFDFTYSQPGGFTTGWYSIGLDLKIINAFAGGFYRCVDGGGVASSLANYSACPITRVTFDIYVDVVVPDQCANIPGVQNAVPGGFYQSGANCYEPDATPTLFLVAQCADTRVRIQSDDANGNGYNVEFSLDNVNWTAVGRSGDGYFYVNLGAGYDFGSVTVYARTNGTRPTYVEPGQERSASGSVGYGPCMGATCAVVSSSPAPWYVTENFTVVYRITNTGSRTWNVGEGYAWTDIAAGAFSQPLSAAVGPGGTWDVTINISTLPSPQDDRLYRWQMTRNGTAFGNYCEFTKDILYRQPDVTCTLQPVGFIEADSVNNPMSITAQYSNPAGGGTAAPGGNLTASTAQVNGVPATRTTPLPLALTRNVPGTVNFTFNAPPAGTFGAGATASFSVPNGIGGNYSLGPINCLGSVTVNVGNIPYLKTFNGDIHAGAQFTSLDPTCTVPANTGGIFGFSRGAGTGSAGASAQFSISSLLSVGGFYSASQRDVALANTLPSLGLTIANDTGGGNSESTTCIPDYFTATRDAGVTEILSAPPASIGAGVGRVRYVHTGDLTISGLTVGLGSQVAVYVDGNVYINGPIVLDNNRGALTDIFQLPYFGLIVRGNIYIDNNVNRIDGLFVAQPSAAAVGGKIYTCAEGMNDHYTLVELWGNCQTSLRVNGSLVARHVRFGRANGTVNSSAPREYPADLTVFNNFGNVGETIIYSPELWLAPSPIGTPNTSDTGNYDSATSLPPVF